MNYDSFLLPPIQGSASNIVRQAPGCPSGAGLSGLRFPGGAYYGATLRQHFVRFQMSPQVRLESALAWRAVRHDATVGSLAIYPAGIECAVEVKESVDALFVAIDPDRLTLAAAESCRALRQGLKETGHIPG